MKQLDPEYRKIGELPQFWLKLVIGESVLFLGSILVLILLSHLQKVGAIGVVETWSLVALALAGCVAAFAWDFWPSKKCPLCSSKMRRERVRPENPSPPSEVAMVLCCQGCKVYVDLKVSGM